MKMAGPACVIVPAVATVYVTGHRNPDLDSIASALGYAELRNRLDPSNRYVPVRLGELNAQARWALERSGAAEPELLDHVRLRARDVMRSDHPVARHGESLRDVGLAMAKGDVDIIPILDDEGAVAGILDHPRPRPAVHQGVERAVELRRPSRVGGPDRGGARRHDGGAAHPAPQRPPVGGDG